MKGTDQFQHESISAFKFGYAPFGKPKLFVHLYFVDGLLIDTGQKAMAKEILATTAQLPVKQMFITHHHEDHTGNISEIQKQHQCLVYAPPLTSEMMKNPPRLSFAQKAVYGSRPSYSHLKPISGNLETPNHSFELIPIPGHAIDMVALYERNKGWLFSADLYINKFIGYFLKGENIGQQIESTKKILGLDFESLFCAHNPQLKNGKQALQEKLDFLEDFYQKVQSKYDIGKSAKTIFKELNLKEDSLIKLLSGGLLSKLNMVESVLESIRQD
ncbi:MAG: MBL fold metallo-hydrolase [Bacteroidota bacterium]